MLMLFCQSLMSVLLSFVAHSAIRWHNPAYGSRVQLTPNGTPIHSSEITWELSTRPGFTACAVFFLLASASSNEALRFVSYPFQSLAKSCKLIPVMMSRVILLKAKYPFSKVRADSVCL